MISGILKSSGRIYRSLLFLFFVILYSISVLPSESVSRQLPSFFDSNQSVQHPDPPAHLHVIAVMVEFQPDSNRFTTGNGTFEAGSIPYLEFPGTNIDALPHDQAYFEAHLEFAKNYFHSALLVSPDGRIYRPGHA